MQQQLCRLLANVQLNRRQLLELLSAVFDSNDKLA